jgi:CRISPR-associated protein Cas1
MLIQAENTSVSIPAAQISCIILEPGTTITHAAINRLAECHTPIIWCGKTGFIFYAAGFPWTHTNANAKLQTQLWANKRKREEIARRMFLDRFGRKPNGSNLQELRLDEGIQMKKLYEATAEKHKVAWHGRTTQLEKSDKINKTITKTYQSLYALALAGILTTGRLPQLGFVHEASDLPLVYDIADKYKQKIGINIAFQAFSEDEQYPEQTAKKLLAQTAKETEIVKNMVSDLAHYLQ